MNIDTPTAAQLVAQNGYAIANVENFDAIQMRSRSALNSVTK